VIKFTEHVLNTDTSIYVLVALLAPFNNGSELFGEKKQARDRGDGSYKEILKQQKSLKRKPPIRFAESICSLRMFMWSLY
jgi:hypothetical protein